MKEQIFVEIDLKDLEKIEQILSFKLFYSYSDRVEFREDSPREYGMIEFTNCCIRFLVKK